MTQRDHFKSDDIRDEVKGQRLCDDETKSKVIDCVTTRISEFDYKHLQTEYHYLRYFHVVFRSIRSVSVGL